MGFHIHRKSYDISDVDSYRYCICYAGGGAGGRWRWRVVALAGGALAGMAFAPGAAGGRVAGSLEQLFAPVQTGVWLALWGNFWRPNRNKTKMK